MTRTLTVIYNGACPICAREIAHYRRQAEAARAAIAFVDLNGSPGHVRGLTPDAAARRLHADDGERMHSGVAAFTLLWDRLPGWRWLARLVRLPGIGAVAGCVYERILAPTLYAMHRRRERRAKQLAHEETGR